MSYDDVKPWNNNKVFLPIKIMSCNMPKTIFVGGNGLCCHRLPLNCGSKPVFVLQYSITHWRHRTPIIIFVLIVSNWHTAVWLQFIIWTDDHKLLQESNPTVLAAMQGAHHVLLLILPMPSGERKAESTNGRVAAVLHQLHCKCNLVILANYMLVNLIELQLQLRDCKSNWIAFTFWL